MKTTLLDYMSYLSDIASGTMMEILGVSSEFSGNMVKSTYFLSDANIIHLMIQV